MKLNSSFGNAKSNLLSISTSWLAKSGSVSSLDENFNVWSSDFSLWDEKDFHEQLTNCSQQWSDLSVAIDTLVDNPYGKNISAALASSKLNATPNLNISTSNNSYDGTKVTLDCTNILVELLSINIKDSNSSIGQTMTAINLQFSDIRENLGSIKDSVELSKEGNLLEQSVQSLETNLQYFINKLSSYLSANKLSNKMPSIIGTLQRKIVVVNDSIKETVKNIDSSFKTCDGIANQLSDIITKQEESLNNVIKEFNLQKDEIEKIVDQEKKNQKSKNLPIKKLFKKVLEDGVFSQATLELMKKILNITDTSSLDNATASLSEINNAISAA